MENGTPSFLPPPITPTLPPADSVAPAPAQTPVIYESRVPRNMPQRTRLGISGWIAITLLVLLVIVIILYIWGATIANRPA